MTTPGQIESISQPITTLETRARALNYIRTRNALFNGLLSSDPQDRITGLNNITQLVKTLAKECYPPKPLETAGTVIETPPRGGDGNESGVSSPLNNYNSSKRSSISDGNNTLYSPLFTDGSGSASISSYATSPIIDFSDVNGELEQPEKEKKLRSQEYLRLMILTILRMSVDCPFADVRNTFKKFLNKLRVRPISFSQ